MRHSEFWSVIDAVFGRAYSRSLARDLALDALDSRTCVQALDDGVEPRDVWHALCQQMDVPVHARDGGDPQRLIPPRR